MRHKLQNAACTQGPMYWLAAGECAFLPASWYGIDQIRFMILVSIYRFRKLLIYLVPLNGVWIAEQRPNRGGLTTTS
jgi:hypothetical protein